MKRICEYKRAKKSGEAETKERSSPDTKLRVPCDLILVLSRYNRLLFSSVPRLGRPEHQKES